ncbi:MAG TPA: hypothetical protein VI462_04350 [Acidimicrobiia bacterium]
MSGPNAAFSVSAEHLPGLVALVALPLAVWALLCGVHALADRRVGWADRLVARLDSLSLGARAALLGALVGATVHAAIVPTHWHDARLTAILFVVDTAGFVVAFAWTLLGRRHWQLVSVAMLGGTVGLYAWYLLTGRETLDLVGLVTTAVELTAALVVLAPAASLHRLHPTGQRWVAAAAVPVSVLSLLGIGAIAGAAQTPASTTAVGATSSAPTGSSVAMPGMPGPSSARTAAPLSLPTTSPAGPITWPDDMSSMAAGMRMAEPNCTAQPTSAQQRAAVNLVDETVRAAVPYQSLAAAKAAGYVPITPPGQPVVHYINPTIYRSGAEVNPEDIPVLVYVNTPHGAVLSAAMYLMPQDGSATPPQPGGCLTQWHIHTDLCFNGGRVVGNDTSGTCGDGTVNTVTRPMMHVWLTSVPGGPLAPDPPAMDQVLAARAAPAPSPPNDRA